MIYAIGDVHGQHVMLRSLLTKLTNVPLRDEDTVLFLGDYVDRGENSRAVIELLLQWKEQRPSTIFLRGNHEQLMLDLKDALPEATVAERARIALTWLHNGGTDTLLSYSAPGLRGWLDVTGDTISRLSQDSLDELSRSAERWLAIIPDAHWDFIRSTELEFITPRYHFVHAGLLDPGQKWQPLKPGIDPRLWIREPFLSSHADFDGRMVVFGHTAQRDRRPLVQRNKVGLDTGAVYGGPLIAGVFNTEENSPPRLTEVIQIPFTRTLTAIFKPVPVDKSTVRKRRSTS